MVRPFRVPTRFNVQARCRQKEYDELVDQLWDGLKVMIPLETRYLQFRLLDCQRLMPSSPLYSDPHPFVSLLTPAKGKKILPRLTRHLRSQQMLTMLTLLVACFSQLDVIIRAPSLDSLEATRERAEVERQTQAFLGSVLQSILPVVAKAGLRLVSGLLGLLLDRSDIVAVTQTRVCLRSGIHPSVKLTDSWSLLAWIGTVDIVPQSRGGNQTDYGQRHRNDRSSIR